MTPEQITDYIFRQDYFSQWLGIQVIEAREHYCLLQMSVRKEMINGLKTVHGGVTFSLADSALAFSGNNSGEAAVALNCVINFIKASREGDVLSAESKLVSNTRKTAVYDIQITNQNQEQVAKFVGTVYKLGRKVLDL
ncbi:hydroxyphenylacetyl-CoA thioesterase PaaI [Elizabethkingia argentiflava]|uniref:Hydroxyphenylacetyl-CoA thioesterase PaaI n=1 Tax=Elizabethkingia argenteiflava TaxID=2681556 RepID=A0A845PUJ2_9FLAO|nr:hydroxyphenylacetyl-CoA thioesterase PaaI [Elizabethkingia argenteiflava]NAW51494.1 hydroxyphenylacetyl-CoA thioesterase PaaI [Elizabethkingia argenteiflava]